MNARFKTSQTPDGKTSYEVVISYAFGHLQIEFKTEKEARKAETLLNTAQFVSASGFPSTTPRHPEVQ